MRFGRYEWRPGLWSSLVVVAVFILLLSLGFWQLDRAAQKRALQADFQRRDTAGALELHAEASYGREQRYRKVWVKGHYDGQHQFLLDNRVYQGRVGYQVLTPLYLDKGEAAVLVNRGWVPMGQTRDDLPAIPVANEPVIVQGVLDFPPDKVFSLGEGEALDPGWPKVIQWIQPDLEAAQLQTRLLPVVVLLDPEQPQGYVREWTPVREFGPERHIGYAVQWFACAAMLVALFVWSTLRPVDAEKTKES